MQFVGEIEEASPGRPRRLPFPFGFLVEGGYAGPMTRVSGGAGILSANYLAPIDLRGAHANLNIARGLVLPFLTGGYTRLFGTGNAVNFGAGADLSMGRTSAIRFEVRDYLRLSGPKQHDVALRVGIVVFLAD